MASSYEDVLSSHEKYGDVLTEDKEGTSKIAVSSYERIGERIAAIADQEGVEILDLRTG